MIYNILFIVFVLGSLAAGAARGFGKSLKNLSGGVVGMVLAGVFCFMFGSTFLAIPAIYNLVYDESLFAGILKKIAYYIILFCIAQVLRWLVFTLIQRFMESDNPAMRTINRVGGALLSCGITVLAVIAIISAVSRGARTFDFCAEIMNSLEDSFLVNFAIDWEEVNVLS